MTVSEPKPILNETSEIPSYREYIDSYRQLLLSNQNDIAKMLSKAHGLLSFSKQIFSSDALAKVFLYFCLHGASTAWVIQNELNMPEASSYWVLKRLRALGIVVPALKVSKIRNSKGGPRPTVWALEGASTEEVATALRLHYKMLSPEFRVVTEVAQTILEDYIVKRQVEEIAYREILIYIKELRIPFSTSEIADMTADYLHDKGIKVWR